MKEKIEKHRKVIGRHIVEQLCKLRETSGDSVTRLAQIAGMERSAFHRILNGQSQVPNLISLVLLSQHFDLPLSYWIPREYHVGEGEDVVVKFMSVFQPQKNSKKQGRRTDKCLLSACDQDFVPLTRQIAVVTMPLSAVEKKQVLDAIKDHTSFNIIKALGSLDRAQRKVILSAMQKVSMVEAS